MPPRVVHGPNQTGGLGAFIESIPPITRVWAGTIFACATAHYLQLLHPGSLALVWPQITQNYHVWRLVTCHAFMAFGMSFVWSMIFLIKYGGQVESEVYRFNPADYLFMLICGALFLVSIPPLVGYPLFFTTSPLIMMVIYVWSRNYPDMQVSIWGLVTIQAFYLPFAFLFMDIVFGASPVPNLFGIAAGHLWWFLTDLYPRSSGRQLVRTPAALKRWLGGMGVGPAPSPAEVQQWGVFRGRGQRLGAS
ncbi:derlin [Raphidocelis subcapitata]|uniref:Derlin n=1 Tax=Raphidocelis subcapitata TaxID=307507 RepID=A0A2V0P255_9CHLO|nr:derlin [Raphidocelis subcapitata]|eukprot:GBF93961.1 derlin [Raphidocelis subcapitata]